MCTAIGNSTIPWTKRVCGACDEPKMQHSLYAVAGEGGGRSLWCARRLPIALSQAIRSGTQVRFGTGPEQYCARCQEDITQERGPAFTFPELKLLPEPVSPLMMDSKGHPFYCRVCVQTIDDALLQPSPCALLHPDDRFAHPHVLAVGPDASGRPRCHHSAGSPAVGTVVAESWSTFVLPSDADTVRLARQTYEPALVHNDDQEEHMLRSLAHYLRIPHLPS